MMPRQYRWLMEGLKTEQPKANKAVSGQLCLPGGGGPYHDAEICYVLTVVLSGAGVSAVGVEIVLADHGRLDPAGLRHMVAASV